MNLSFACALVRGWVDIYTRGLPAEVRFARSNEIENDLWCQQEDARATERSGRALAVEILARLVLGIPADLAWRFERWRPVERSSTTSTRIIALLAIAGGLGLTGVFALLAFFVVIHPDPSAASVLMMKQPPLVRALVPIGSVALIAVSLALGWLGLILGSRYESAIPLLAILGAPAGFAALAGAPPALAILAATSAAVVIYLAWIQAVHWLVALVHLASASGIVLALNAYHDHTILSIAIILWTVYNITWIAIGLELLVRGLPQARPTAPSAG